MEEIFIGIDFGTTQSTAVYYDPLHIDQLNLVKDHHGSVCYSSSLVFENIREGKVIFGNSTSDIASTGNYVCEIKRFLGKKYSDIMDEIEEDDKKYTMYSFVEGENDELLFELIDENGNSKRMCAEELIAIQLSEIRKIMEVRMNRSKFDCVVISAPVSFDDNLMKDALKRAYEIAGFKVINFISEPSAAVFHFTVATNENFKRCMLIDIGGGTTDVVIGEKQENGKINVLSSAGDQECGGSDLDKILMDMIIKELIGNGVDESLFTYNSKDASTIKKRKMLIMRNLKKESEKAKIVLSKNKYATVTKENIFGESSDYNFDDIVISREDFEEKINESEFLTKIEDCMKLALSKSKRKLRKTDIDKVILV